MDPTGGAVGSRERQSRGAWGAELDHVGSIFSAHPGAGRDLRQHLPRTAAWGPGRSLSSGRLL